MKNHILSVLLFLVPVHGTELDPPNPAPDPPNLAPAPTRRAEYMEGTRPR